MDQEPYVADPEALQIIDRLVRSCPSFTLDPEDADLPWCAAGAIGSHLADLIQQNRGQEAADTLAEVEQIFHEYPDKSTAVNLLTVGLMEGVSPWRDDFAALLGPESLRWWNGLNAYMGGRQPRLQPLDEYPDL
jgi:hypothetical protein